MILTAIIAVRNEALYLDRCCEHLHAEGVRFAIIDNESSDETRMIAESYRGRGLQCIVSHPYPGYYDWTGLLACKEQLSRELDGDWFMHLDADEIPEAPQRPYALLDYLSKVDTAGYTAVNFDEFVFLPTSKNEQHEGNDYVQSMTQYYFFEPNPERLIRAWRRTNDIDLVSRGGHNAVFGSRRIFPENFALRHYIALSADHLERKYLQNRVYSTAEVARGWHAMRSRITKETLCLPSVDDLFDIRTDLGWNRSKPFKHHLFVR